MAFESSKFSLLGGQANSNCGRLFQYQTVDLEATVEGSGYFNEKAGDVAVDDLIFTMYDTDGTPGATILRVASNDGTTVTTADILAAGTIELADGSMLIGNGDGVAAAVPISHVVKFAGEHTTTGGDASETISVSGVLATDIAICQLKTEGSSPVTVDAAAAATDQINVTMSADPSTDHVISYMVIRAST
jgi:hypothetical protein